MKKNKNSGIALGLVLIALLVMTVIVAGILKHSQNSGSLSKEEAKKRQATLVALQGADKIRNILAAKFDTLVANYKAGDPNTHITFDTPASLNALIDSSVGLMDSKYFEITPIGEGVGTTGALAFQSTLTNSTKLPKLVQIRVTGVSPDGDVRSSVIQSLSFNKSSLYDYAYILSNQPNDITIGGPTTFGGQAILLFQNPSQRTLGFDTSTGNINFDGVFQTNLGSENQLNFASGSSSSVHFSAGAAFNTSAGVAGSLASQRSSLIASDGTIKNPVTTVPSATTAQFWVDSDNKCNYSVSEIYYTNVSY
ncbi:MAG: hypothetical protein J0L93_08005 [Deltaproteobacteria bacterium]|nr:hypothetical protein [Deltaproteobacteria bacterium]